MGLLSSNGNCREQPIFTNFVAPLHRRLLKLRPRIPLFSLSPNSQGAKLATRATNHVCRSLHYGATRRRQLPTSNQTSREIASHSRTVHSHNVFKSEPASRHDSYLTIREFFTSSGFHAASSPKNSSSLPILHRARYSNYGTAWPPTNSSRRRLQPKDTSTESDWLQERDILLPTFDRDHVPPPRFDWRMRASSRTRKGVKLEGQKQRNTRRIKRHAPPVMDVQMGQPFFEEINAYQER